MRQTSSIGITALLGCLYLFPAMKEPAQSPIGIQLRSAVRFRKNGGLLQ